MPKPLCLHCNIELTSRFKPKFCSNQCQQDHRGMVFIAKWKKGLVDGNTGISTQSVSAHIKTYLCRESKGICSLCGWNKIHKITGKVPLEIDHIDGNSENNSESNLRLICPNCHSLTPNYKALNWGKGRKWRMEKYIKNDIV